MSSNLDRYERIAPLYDLLDLPFEYSRYRKIRPLLFQGLKGRVLDAGVGTGRNIQFYPPEAKVVGIDISPAMLARADRRRVSLGSDVELYKMDVTHLAFEDQSFDAAVATFLFCVLPDDLQVPAGEGMQGGMGALFGSRVTPTMNLSVDDVRGYLAVQLDRLNNKRLKVGDIKADDGAITADIVTIDNSLVQRLKVNRHTGTIEYQN